MYPYFIIKFSDGSGIGLYEIFILLGMISALILFRILADQRNMPAKLQNLILFGAVVACVFGYLSAVLFQGIYNALETGEFSLTDDTGATFYGGFIGGALCLLLIYFIGGKIIYKQNTLQLQWFPTLANIAAICIPSAHAFGRIGCLMAGCCHGAETSAWYGTFQYIEIEQRIYAWRNVVPIQLFEAIFLFILALILLISFWKGKGFQFPLYLAGYGTWRFIIEFFRTDDRGASFIKFLTPSQFTAIIMIMIAVVIFVVFRIILYKKGKNMLHKGKNKNTEENL